MNSEFLRVTVRYLFDPVHSYVGLYDPLKGAGPIFKTIVSYDGGNGANGTPRSVGLIRCFSPGSLETKMLRIKPI